MDSLKDFFSSGAEFAGKVADSVHSDDRKYRRLKNSLQQIVPVLVITGVATAAIGLIALSFGSLTSFALASFMGYISYNSFVLAGNMNKIAEKPAAYFSAFGLVDGLDTRKLKDDLTKGTFGCAFILNNLVDFINSSKVRA